MSIETTLYTMNIATVIVYNGYSVGTNHIHRDDIVYNEYRENIETTLYTMTIATMNIASLYTMNIATTFEIWNQP